MVALRFKRRIHAVLTSAHLSVVLEFPGVLGCPYVFARTSPPVAAVVPLGAPAVGNVGQLIRRQDSGNIEAPATAESLDFFLPSNAGRLLWRRSRELPMRCRDRKSVG